MDDDRVERREGEAPAVLDLADGEGMELPGQGRQEPVKEGC
jgi:hypothetical protein